MIVGSYPYSFGSELTRELSVAQKNRPSTMLSFTVQSIDPLWRVWSDGAEWRDNRMATQHLSRDL